MNDEEGWGLLTPPFSGSFLLAFHLSFYLERFLLLSKAVGLKVQPGDAPLA